MENNIKIGDVFFKASLWDGTIVKWTIIDDLGDSLITRINYENGSVEELNYSLSSFSHSHIFKTLDEAKDYVQDDILRVEELFSTPEKMLSYIALNILHPLSECSYYDIVGNASLSQLEINAFRNRAFEFWGYCDA